MELYIIRHAQSQNNALIDQRDRVSDPSLTDLGHRQAEAIAEHLASGINLDLRVGVSAEDTSVQQRRGYGITRLFCSAMHRSLQTARPIGQALDLKPELWVDIHEHGGIYLDHGGERGIVGYPGRTRSEILEEFPTYAVPEAVTEDGWWTGGQEDWPGCHGRAIKVAAQLYELAEAANDGDRVAIVSHGGFIDALLKAFLNQLPNPGTFFHHYNTAITRVDFHPEGGLSFRYQNRIPHLSPELVS